MPSPKTKSPGSANTTRAKSETSTAANFTRIVREIVAVLTVGAMMATMFWTSVFGMTGQFGPGPEISINERLAAGGDDGQ